MRAIVTCDWFLKYASTQTAALARAGAEVLLLCRDHAFEFAGDRHERERTLAGPRAAGVEVVELPGRYWDPTAAPALAAVRRRIARFRPDVVHAQSGADPRALILIPRRVPVVLTIHDPVPHPGQPVAREAVRRWFLDYSRDGWRERASVIVIHSESLRGEVALASGQTCRMIPHGLEIQDDPLPPPPELAIGFFGRLTPYKGLDVLAASMPAVWEARPEVRVSIVGAGEEPLALDDPRVVLRREYLPEDEIGRFLATLSLTVLPYTQASQTGSGSTSVGYGVPIVASQVGGLPDLTLDDSYIVRNGDAGALAEAIVRHIDDGAAVRQRVLDEVARPRSWDSLAVRSLEVYADAVSHPHRHDA